MRCPICGTHFIPAPGGPGPWKRQEWQEFAYQAGPGVLPQGVVLTREEPLRGQTKESDVVVPFLKAIVYGVTGGMLSLLVSVPLTLTNDWPLWSPPVGAGVASLLSFSLAWVLLDADARRTLWKLEEWTGADMNQGYVGPQVKTVRVELVESSRRMRLVDLPLPDEKLRLVASAVLDTARPFSRRGMSNILSEGEFTMLSNAMLEGGLVRWHQPDNPRSGYELTPAGRAVLRRLVGRGVAGEGDGETDVAGE